MAFQKTDGVIWVAAVSSADGYAKVIFDKSISNTDDMVSLVNATGFKGSVMPASAVTFADAKDNSTCTAAQKAACKAAAASGKTISAEHKAACAASGKTCTKGATATASVQTINSESVKQCSKTGNYSCEVLTASEKAAFCAEFCKSDKETKDSNKDI